MFWSFKKGILENQYICNKEDRTELLVILTSHCRSSYPNTVYFPTVNWYNQARQLKFAVICCDADISEKQISFFTMLKFPEKTHSRASALPACTLMCTVGMYQCPLGIPFFFVEVVFWKGWLNGFHSAIWLRLTPPKRNQEDLHLWLRCCPIVPLREKRKSFRRSWRNDYIFQILTQPSG